MLDAQLFPDILPVELYCFRAYVKYLRNILGAFARFDEHCSLNFARSKVKSFRSDSNMEINGEILEIGLNGIDT